MSAHEPEGTTTGASLLDRTSSVWRAIARASAWNPPLYAGWPQQVRSSGTSTATPSRSSRRTTASATAG